MDEPDGEKIAASALAWLGVREGVQNADTDAAPTVAAAVLAFIDTLPGEFDSRRELGAIMLTARLIRRRNSPEGVSAFTETGAVYVRRNDPDVALMLGMDAYKKPRVG